MKFLPYSKGVKYTPDRRERLETSYGLLHGDYFHYTIWSKRLEYCFQLIDLRQKELGSRIFDTCWIR